MKILAWFRGQLFSPPPLVLTKSEDLFWASQARVIRYQPIHRTGRSNPGEKNLVTISLQVQYIDKEGIVYSGEMQIEAERAMFASEITCHRTIKTLNLIGE